MQGPLQWRQHLLVEDKVWCLRLLVRRQGVALERQVPPDHLPVQWQVQAALRYVTSHRERDKGCIRPSLQPADRH